MVDQCPALRESLDRYGREDYAEAAAEAIMRVGAEAVPDPMMQRSLGFAIKRFGRESVADALEIPLDKATERYKARAKKGVQVAMRLAR